jgi:hypothetical protein
MRYKALAVRIRQAAETKDPKPTSKLLVEPLHKAVKTYFAKAVQKARCCGVKPASTPGRFGK